MVIQFIPRSGKLRPPPDWSFPSDVTKLKEEVSGHSINKLCEFLCSFFLTFIVTVIAKQIIQIRGINYLSMLFMCS